MYCRVCAAIFRKKSILMVKQREKEKIFWTLPGGGIKIKESPEAAILREVKEETGLQAKVSSLLYEIELEAGRQQINEKCYLLKTKGQNPILGYDPEHSGDSRTLLDVAWIPISRAKNDLQVTRVISALKKENAIKLCTAQHVAEQMVIA